MKCFFFLALLQLSLSAWANVTLDIQGQWIQGGFLKGKVAAGSEVVILDQPAYVDPEGHFVFGVGRDISEVIVHVTSPSGEGVEFPFTVTEREYQVQRIDGVEKKYVSPPESVLVRIREENGQVYQARQTLRKADEFKQGFVMPAEGVVTGVYGSQRVFNGVPKRPHYGLDIAAPVGTPILAPAAGKVTLVHSDMYYSGGTLIIDHGQGVSSTFIHLDKIHVEVGQEVVQGEQVADMGKTGRVTGPHLDWRVNWFNQRLDPQLLLPKKTAIPQESGQ